MTKVIEVQDKGKKNQKNLRGLNAQISLTRS